MIRRFLAPRLPNKPALFVGLLSRHGLDVVLTIFGRCAPAPQVAPQPDHAAGGGPTAHQHQHEDRHRDPLRAVEGEQVPVRARLDGRIAVLRDARQAVVPVRRGGRAARPRRLDEAPSIAAAAVVAVARLGLQIPTNITPNATMPTEYSPVTT